MTAAAPHTLPAISGVRMVTAASSCSPQSRRASQLSTGCSGRLGGAGTGGGSPLGALGALRRVEAEQSQAAVRLRELSGMFESLRHAHSELSSTHEALRLEHEALQGRHSALQDQHEALHVENKTLRNEFKRSCAARDDYAEEAKRARSYSLDAFRTLVVVEQQVTELRQEHVVMMQRHDALTAEVRMLQIEREVVSSRIQQVNSPSTYTRSRCGRLSPTCNPSCAPTCSPTCLPSARHESTQAAHSCPTRPRRHTTCARPSLSGLSRTLFGNRAANFATITSAAPPPCLWRR